jgi:hypothetical protein
MTKLLIATFITAGLLAGCGNDAAAPKTAPAASTPAAKAAGASGAGSAPTAATAVSETKPIVAPKPPPPPGGGQSAPELKPEDIVRIQEMLKKRNAEKPAAAAPAASAPATK